ncbi:MAG: pyruvate formate lyase family protein [Dehalococcoidia bacterium]
MNTAVKQRKDEKVIKAIKGLYRGLERIDDSAGYRANVRLCLERARLVTQSDKETDGQPMVIRRAKALEKILENMTIFIQDNEQIVGNIASDPSSVPTYPEMFVRWLNKAVQDEYKHMIDDEGRQELFEIHKYWENKCAHGKERELVPDSVKAYSKYNGVFFWSYQWDSTLPAYERIFRTGLRAIVNDCKARLEEIGNDKSLTSQEYGEMKRFLEAAIITVEAAITFARRYAALAREKAAAETDPAKKAALEGIAERCERVPENPCESFHDTLQAFFLIHIIVDFIEMPSVGSGFRLDYVCYPWYKKDLDEGRLTREDALNLLEFLWIKLEEMGYVHPPVMMSAGGGGLAWQNITLAGCDKEGNAVCNDLSYLILEATMELQSVQPPLCFRYHDKTPRDLILKAIDCQSTGVAQPAFFNDKVMIPYFLERGFPIEDARDYAINNCMAWQIPGKNIVNRQSMGHFSIPKCLDLALNQGIDNMSGRQLGARTPDPNTFQSIDDVLDAFWVQYNFFVEKNVALGNAGDMVYEELLPRPFTTIMLDDSIDMALDCRKWQYFPRSWLLMIGGVTTADSLAAIKKLVFDEKKITMAELRQALDSNFEGQEELRQMLLNCPKFGNDDDYVDDLARVVFYGIASELKQYISYYGEPYDIDGTSASMGYFTGAGCGATPDGRFAKEPLPDGNISPAQGRDIKGPTAVLKSVGKIDPLKSHNHLLNQRFSPQFLMGDFREIFADYLKTWSDLMIHHIQFNIVKPEELHDAQEKPEEHEDLIVRVSGYAAYFVDLTTTLQDDIIARTEQEFVA